MVKPEGISTNAAFFEARLLELGAGRRADEWSHATAAPGARAARPVMLGPHRHIADCHELTMATRGSGQVATLAEAYELAPGRLLLIDRGVDHEELPRRPSGGCTVFWCGAYDSLVRLGETSYAPPDRYVQGPTLLLNGRTDIESIMEAIASEVSRRDWGWLESVNGLLKYLTAILIRRLHRGTGLPLRQAESFTVCADSRTWQVIRDVLRFCDANFQRSLRLSDVAAAVGYSPNHLSRLFSLHVGHSIFDYLAGLRMTAARHLLEHSNAPIHEVAEAVGYSDHSHFTRAFIRVTGRSPKAYRKLLVGR